MRKAKLVILMAAMTAFAVSASACGSSKTASNASTEVTTEAGENGNAGGYTDTDNPVYNYKDSDSAKYALILNGESHDITDYVVSCEDGICMVKSSILTDFFGFTPSDRSTEADMKEYTKDGKVLQLAVGANDIIYDGTTNKISGTIEKVDGADDVSISMDFLLCIGDYNSYGTSVIDDVFTVEPNSDTEITYSGDEDGFLDAETPVEGETVDAEMSETNEVVDEEASETETAVEETSESAELETAVDIQETAE